MKLICSYCRKLLGEKVPFENSAVTHGLCPECHQAIMKQLEGVSFSEYLEDFGFPVLIVNEEGRVLTANEQALATLQKRLQSIQGFLGGEALECAYARLPEGCGETVHCATCTIRRLVDETRGQRQCISKRDVTLYTEKGEMRMTISSSYFESMVRLVIHDAVY